MFQRNAQTSLTSNYSELLVAIYESRSPCAFHSVNPALQLIKIEKNIAPGNQFIPHKPCKKPNQQVQINFAGPITN